MDNNNEQWGNQPQQDQQQWGEQQQWNGQTQYNQQQWNNQQQYGQQQWNNQQQYDQQWSGQATPVNTLPMKWHKFLIYFALWAGGILNIISGIVSLSGTQYDAAAGFSGATKWLYMLVDGLQAANVIYGICLIALGIYCIYTRFQLAGFKIGAPQKLGYVYIVASVVGLLYVIAISAILSDYGADSLDMTSTYSSLITSVIMVIVNKIYYDKRASLFVN